MLSENVNERCHFRKKYQGMVTLTHELLTEILSLPEGVRVKSMRISDANFKADTMDIILESDKETSCTHHVPEGAVIERIPHEVLINEEVKTITSVRRVKL